MPIRACSADLTNSIGVLLARRLGQYGRGLWLLLIVSASLWRPCLIMDKRGWDINNNNLIIPHAGGSGARYLDRF